MLKQEGVISEIGLRVMADLADAEKKRMKEIRANLAQHAVIPAAQLRAWLKEYRELRAKHAGVE